MKTFKIGVIGSVSSTEKIIQKLIEYHMKPACILGYETKDVKLISGYRNFKNIAQLNNIPYKAFKKINDNENKDFLKKYDLDIIFAVGFSQLLDKEILETPKLGTIGFHPTKLPEGRGRAALAWLILENKNGAASFFLMKEGMDDGPIFIQKEFEVNDKDDAQTIEHKTLIAIEMALDEWLPELQKGIWNPIPQAEYNATYYGKRNPEDGIIDWHKSASEINALIRASTTPNPKAYSFLKKDKIEISNSKVEKDIPIRGVVGRILAIRNNEYLVQCGQGLIWIMNIDNKDSNTLPKIGDKLGFYSEFEIYKIYKLLNNHNINE